MSVLLLRPGGPRDQQARAISAAISFDNARFRAPLRAAPIAVLSIEMPRSVMAIFRLREGSFQESPNRFGVSDGRIETQTK